MSSRRNESGRKESNFIAHAGGSGEIVQKEQEI